MNLKKISLLTGVLAHAAVFAAGPVDYATPTGSNFSAKSGNWNKASNWDKKQVPEGFVNVMIAGGKSVTISDAVSLSGGIFLGGESDRAPAKLFITEGSQINANILSLRDVMNGAQAEVFMSGGQVELGERGLCIGKGATHSGMMKVEISGGKFRGLIHVGTRTQGRNVGLLRVLGSAPDIANGDRPKDDFVLQDTGIVEFVLDEKGVAVLNFKTRRALFPKEGGKIRVDGAAYNGGTRKIPLIIAGQTTGNPPDVEFVNFPPKYRAQSEWETKKEKTLVLKISETKK